MLAPIPAETPATAPPEITVLFVTGAAPYLTLFSKTKAEPFKTPQSKE